MQPQVDKRLRNNAWLLWRSARNDQPSGSEWVGEAVDL
jgi:hypothetical protein